jgi:hypothetical protein
MKTLIGILILSVFGAIAISPLTAYASKTFKSEAVQKTGDDSYLFGSGTQDVTKEFCLNDIVPVYRDVAHGWAIKGYGEVQSRDKVGDIKISSYIGNQNFRAQVMDGSVQPGDMAIKEGASCTVAPAR